MKNIIFSSLFALITILGFSQNDWVPTNGPYGGNCIALKNINNEIYAGTNCGIYSTSDDGITWKNKCAGLIGECNIILDIELLGNTLIAGSYENGIFLSNDLGNNWIQSNAGILLNPLLDMHISDVFINGTEVLIGTGNGVYKSTNQGLSWAPSNIGINETNNICANKFVNIGTTIFLSTGSDIYKSNDNGFSWIDLNNSIQANLLSLVSMGGSLYCFGALGLYKSINNGSSWVLLSNNLPLTSGYLFSSGNNLYSSQNGSTYISTDGGINWSFIVNKIFNTITQANNKVFSGSQEGVYSWVNGTAAVVNSGLGGSSITNVIFQDGVTMYAGNNNGIYKSTDNGNIWINLGLNLPLNSIVECITKSGSNLIIGTTGNGVYISSDNGSTWLQSNSGLTINGVYYSDITSLFQYNGRVFMGATENSLATLFISDNNGVSWTQSATGLQQNCHVTSICNFGQYIVIGTFSGVYISTDNGASWLFDGLSVPITSVCSNATSYFGTFNTAIHSTIDMGNSWDSFFTSGDPITTIANLNGIIYIAQNTGSKYLLNGNWTDINSSGLSGGPCQGLCTSQTGSIFIGCSASVLYGGWYYVLNNGVSKYIGATNNLDEIQSKINYSISPNPTSSKITVKASLALIGKEFNIYDQLGKAVKSGIITAEETEIDLSNISEGVYLFKSGTEMQETFKIIKQ